MRSGAAHHGCSSTCRSTFKVTAVELIDRWVQLELASIRRSAEPRNAVRFVGGSHPPVIFDPCNIKPLDMLGKSRTDFEKAYIADQGETHSNALTLYGGLHAVGRV